MTEMEIKHICDKEFLEKTSVRVKNNEITVQLMGNFELFHKKITAFGKETFNAKKSTVVADSDGFSRIYFELK